MIKIILAVIGVISIPFVMYYIFGRSRNEESIHKDYDKELDEYSKRKS